MRVTGRTEQQAIDRLWQKRTGLPLLLLMESAASAVSKLCLDLIRPKGIMGATVLVLAGKGQNGGDAFACARQLDAAGCQVICREMFPDEVLPSEAAANRQALLNLGWSLGLPGADDFSGLTAGSLIVDGIFGTGYRASRPLPPAVVEVAAWSAAARLRGAQIIAIDVPTGLDADSGALAMGTIHADFTVTFISGKIGLCAAPGRFFAGQVLIDGIGVPMSLVDEVLEQQTIDGQQVTHLITADEILKLCPPRPADSHKGNFGQVLFLGGAPGMPGAALLASEAAARSGAGLLTIAVPEAIGSLMLSARPEGLLHQLPEDSERAADLISRLINKNQVIIAGPGAGRAEWLRSSLTQIIHRSSQLVLDADALNLLAEDSENYFAMLRDRRTQGLAPAILTPHPGEFRRLLPDCSLTDRQAAARTLAVHSGCVTVLKGASTVVATPEGTAWINPTGHDGLSRGGSGDVLSGLLSGLLAQGMGPSTAAVAGVYLHGLSADLAAVRLGHRAMLPGDVIAAFGDAFRTAGWEKPERSTLLHGSSIS